MKISRLVKYSIKFLRKNQVVLLSTQNQKQKKLKKYFEEIIPDYSKERVYLSDIKKIILWYNLLHKKELLIKEEPEKATDSDKKESKTDSAPASEKKKKKSTPRLRNDP